MKQDQYILSADEQHVAQDLKRRIDALQAEFRAVQFGVSVAVSLLAFQNGLEDQWKFSDDFTRLIPVKQDEGKPDPDNEGK